MSTARKIYLKTHRHPRQINPVFSDIKTIGYILGVLKGDGYIHADKKGHYVIALNVKSLKFAKSFRRALKKINLNPIRIFIDGRGTFWVRAQSKDFYNWYKGLELNTIFDLIKGNEIEFIRGFYEAEGNVSYGDYTYRLRISNTNYDILEFIKNYLISIGITNTIKQYTNKTSNCVYYQLGIYKDAEKFLKSVNPCLKYIVNGKIIK